MSRAEPRVIFGQTVPVASLADVVQGKVWAWSDSTRRESKRAKDETDLLRLGENYPEVINLLPPPLRERLERQQARGTPTDENGWDDDPTEPA